MRAREEHVQRPGIPSIRSGNQAADGPEQLIQLERLGQAVLDPELTGRGLGEVPVCGDNKDRCFGAPLSLATGFQKSPPVQHRHHQVEHDKIGRPTRHPVQRYTAVLGREDHISPSAGCLYRRPPPGRIWQRAASVARWSCRGSGAALSGHSRRADHIHRLRDVQDPRITRLDPGRPTAVQAARARANCSASRADGNVTYTRSTPATCSHSVQGCATGVFVRRLPTPTYALLQLLRRPA
jgi:hypothetical protein